MPRTSNYTIQARMARERFLSYDQEALIRKLGIPREETWLSVTLLSAPFRIHRKTGEIQAFSEGQWQETEDYATVMTLLDLVCDSREDRFLAHRWKSMRDFGHQFHRQLLEEADPWAERFQAQPDRFRKACQALGGRPLPQGDIAYAIELFDGLEIALQLWFGDEEFPPNLRLLWDENALMYLKYETMYFAKDLLLQHLGTFFN